LRNQCTVLRGERGAVLYRQYCTSCHGSRGAGEAVVPQFIRQPGYIRAPALNETEHAWHHSDENLIKTILEGSPRKTRMKHFKHALTKSDARDLVDYIKESLEPTRIGLSGPETHVMYVDPSALQK
jgi:mono/diheme cytochrome c family protein